MGKKIAKIKFTKKHITGFNVHETTVRSLFKKHGLKENQVLRTLVQPDSHCPEHDIHAISAFKKFAKDYKPHMYINLGDMSENSPSSHWPPTDSKPRRLVPEMKITRQVQQEILDACGKQCISRFFLIANHEFWTQMLLSARVPEIIDDIEDLGIDLTIENLMGLKEMGFKIIPFNDILKIGYAHFIHGYYTGQHHAAKHLQVLGVNVYYGHLHDVQSHTAVSVDGLKEAMSLGCLRTLDAPFLRGKPNNWCHALGIFEFRIDGSYTRMVPIIVDGKFSFNGKLYDGTI